MGAGEAQDVQPDVEVVSYTMKGWKLLTQVVQTARASSRVRSYLVHSDDRVDVTPARNRQIRMRNAK